MMADMKVFRITEKEVIPFWRLGDYVKARRKCIGRRRALLVDE
jgi:hypothetical protein